MTQDVRNLTVWKFSVPVEDEFSLIMPRGAKILHFDTQHEAPTLWALVDPSAELADPRRFRFAGTGHRIVTREGDELCYIGTSQMLGGNLAFHLFEIV